MTDRDALLAAIIANPDEDTPRLAYADLIQEAGEEERAEFIRVQCELARLNRGPDCPICGWPFAKSVNDGCVPNNCCYRPREGTSEYFGVTLNRAKLDALRRREQELWLHSRDWFNTAPIPNKHPATTKSDVFAAFAQTAGGPGFASLVQRGFIQAVLCTAADWLAHADAILATHPVRKVVLTTRPTSAERQSRKKFNGLSEWMRFVHKYSGPDGTEKFLKDYWPGIEFELPLMPHTLSGTVRIAGELLADSVLNVAPIIPPGYINT